jgi:hypothetical protein
MLEVLMYECETCGEIYDSTVYIESCLICGSDICDECAESSSSICENCIIDNEIEDVDKYILENF